MFLGEKRFDVEGRKLVASDEKVFEKRSPKSFFFLFRGRIPASAGVEAEVSENKRQ